MKLYETLETQLKTENNFVADNGELKKWVVINKAQNYDADLIGLLLDNKELKQKFFIDVKGTLVFNQNLFVQFLEQKNYLNDSYTQYKNKVGLTINGKYIKQRNEVALVWPFKDCVLEGGQSKEEDKREEIFFNEILAQDEITQLLEPKVLTSAKIYDKDGEKEFSLFTRDAELNKKRGLPENTINDNLIIKGNNLLALHSLKKEFTGKVKLIYIDPPYNTDGDSFAYNDSFNHSSWLTFMKNRLEVAKELLVEDGVIFVQIDYIEQAYLKVLMDSIFGKNQSLPEVSVKTSTPAGFKVINPGLVNVSESILVYVKGNKKNALKKGYVKAGYQKDYNKIILNKDEPSSNWIIENISDFAIKKLGFKSKAELNKKFDKKTAQNLLETEIENIALDNANSVFATYGPHKPSSKMKEGIKLSKANPLKVIEIPNESNGLHYLIKGRLLAFYSNKLQNIDGETVPTQRLSDFWDDLSWDSLSNEGGVTLKNGKKPEALLKRIIEISTNENDIVLDYHLGSGTTSAVAHKMNRQYIGIEQLDYGDNDSSIRLQNVIGKDLSGISKSINWQGGGSFIYLELKKYNQTFINQIEKAKDINTLLAIWEEMKVKSFLNYNVDIQKQEEHLEDFKKLDLAKQKQHLIEILDKNQLYVNLSSLDDKDFSCSEKEKQVTKDFYQLNND
ncbi:MAG: site-specific DNA-methyltransferase [Flavobacteriaceae bacterium]|nr:site-specific DNA-methyltransferase [Flavobacteriaceae bacterium]